MGQIRNLLGAFLFKGDDVEKLVGVLSGGEKSRLALAKMLCAPAPLLCLDEPTNHLDISSSDVLEQALKSFEGTVLLITHDRHLINSVATKVVEIEPKKITIYDGNYDYYMYKKSLDGKDSTEVKSAQAASKNNRMDAPQYEGAKPRIRSKAPKVNDSGPKTKEQKRAEAQRRNAIYAATHGLKDEIADINQKLQIARERMSEITELLKDPDFYVHRDDAPQIIEEHGLLKSEIAELEDRWLDVSTKIEEAQKL